MFGFFSRDNSVLVQPVYRNGNSLAFATQTVIDAETGVAIRDHSGRHAEVEIRQRRRVDDSTWLYFAELVSGELDSDVDAPKLRLRRSPRFPVGVRVRSPQLPDFMALTEDLSVEGAQLQLSGPVRVGEELQMELDLDGGYAPVRVLARVCWSRLSFPWRAGVAFLRIAEDGQADLRSFLGQRYGELSSQERETDRAERPDHSMLRKQAFLHSSYDDGDAVILKLITEDEVMELRFSKPRVLQADLVTQMVGNIVTQPGAEGLIQTRLLDPQGHVLIAIESLPPDIICRSIRAGELD